MPDVVCRTTWNRQRGPGSLCYVNPPLSTLYSAANRAAKFSPCSDTLPLLEIYLLDKLFFLLLLPNSLFQDTGS